MQMLHYYPRALGLSQTFSLYRAVSQQGSLTNVVVCEWWGVGESWSLAKNISTEPVAWGSPPPPLYSRSGVTDLLLHYLDSVIRNVCKIGLQACQTGLSGGRQLVSQFFQDLQCREIVRFKARTECQRDMGSARHLYVVCIYGAICLQIQKYFPPDPAIFSPKNKILILLYIVYRFMQNISIFHGKKTRYDVLKIKFVDISPHRYKLRRDIE